MTVCTAKKFKQKVYKENHTITGICKPKHRILYYNRIWNDNDFITTIL